jgi:hypothetical protein
VLIEARGTRAWRLRMRVHLPRGRYRLYARAVDRKGNKERPKRSNYVRFRVR